MGTWGSGPFDDDIAADFVADFDEDPEVATIETPLEKIANATPKEHLEAPDCSEAIAAAALIALTVSPDADVVSEKSLAMLRAIPAPDKKRLGSMAITALGRIGAESELKELWDESGDAASREAWHASLQTLRRQLATL